jgi:hypothetical protein
MNLVNLKSTDLDWNAKISSGKANHAGIYQDKGKSEYVKYIFVKQA